MKKIIRVGIAGYGRSGKKIHSEILKNLPKFKIVAVADEILERRKDAKKQFGAKTYKSYKELIEDGDYDLFINALPSFLHTEATIQALNKGKHVVCEKPFAINVKNFDNMVAASEQNNKLLFPFQNHRFQPFYLKIKEIINSGVLGEIINIKASWANFKRRWDWQIYKKNMGGMLNFTGPHIIDQIIDLFGENKKPEIFCKLKCNNAFGGDADDFCSIVLKGNSLPLIEITLSSYLVYSDFNKGTAAYVISGTNGGLIGNAFEIQWKYFDSAKAPKHELWKWSVNYGYCSEELPWVEKEWKIDEELKKDVVGFTIPCVLRGVEKYYKNIYDVLVNNKEPIVKLSQVRKQVEIIEECHKQNE